MIIYHNAVVFTAQGSLAQAFGVENGKFTFVGSNEEADRLSADQRIDLAGAFVCPGFHDSHMHLLNYGQTLSMAPLHRFTGSLADMLQSLRDSGPGRSGWILGRGWNQDYFSDEKRMPNRWDLDQVSFEHPVCAVRACGHALAVNSRALEILGVHKDTPPIPGGTIGMERGEPNGLFFDNAMDLVLPKIPSPTLEEVKNMIRLACGELNRHGITSCGSDDYCVFQNLSWETVNEAFRQLEQEGDLSVRVNEQANFTNSQALEGFLKAGNTTGSGSEYFRIGPLKLLGDGALGARTAYLSKPYADDPSTCGLSVFTKEQFDQLIGMAHSNGMQVAVHCIGDACLDLVLDSLEKALTENPRDDHRHGIVHCQITRPDQLRRISALNLQVYAQSIFLDYDLHIVHSRVGSKLAESSYSWKTLLNSGVNVSNGSDCPVEMPDVMAGIQCAVTRCDRKGSGPYLPHEAFTVEEALMSFTAAGARASFQENCVGTIAPNLLADFVVLGGNPLSSPVQDLQDIPILAAYLGGKKVYSAQNG